MSESPQRRICPDCDDLNRREFIKTTAAGVAAASAASATLLTPLAARAADKTSRPETLVTSFYKTLTPEQKKMVAFSFDDPLRQEVNNNWRITDARIGQHFTKDQQAMIRDIFLGLHSPEYADKVMAQVEHDNGKEGFGRCSLAMFGEPGSGRFEFVLSGRHVTRRCDGDSVAGAAFGGPSFYGHAAESFNEKADHPGNIYWYQAKRANELYQALDGKQRKIALRSDPRPEQKKDTVKLRGKGAKLNGIPVSELTADQKKLLHQVMADVLAPFRKADTAEAMKLIEKGGFDNLHLSYFNNKELDIGGDGVWDVWQIEGPAMVWYFRGAPHVHTWVHIRQPV